MPISRRVAAMRQAISPRFAIRTFLNMPASASRQPAGLALLEERRKPIARLLARAHLGERARQRGDVVLPGRVAPPRQHLLDAALGVGAALEQLAHALL